jgi:hypothetical protein
MYTESSVKISEFFDYCFLFLRMFSKLHLIAKYFIKIVLTARFADIFPSLKMKILLYPFNFLLFRHPIMQLKAKNSKKNFLHLYKNECVLRHCESLASLLIGKRGNPGRGTEQRQPTLYKNTLS